MSLRRWSLSITSITGIPRARTFRGRSRCSHLDTRAGKIETITSSKPSTLIASWTAGSAVWCATIRTRSGLRERMLLSFRIDHCRRLHRTPRARVCFPKLRNGRASEPEAQRLKTDVSLPGGLDVSHDARLVRAGETKQQRAAPG